MSYAAIGLATVLPVALGALVVIRGGPRRVGWLLVAHGVSVGLLLGGAGIASSSTTALAVEQLLYGSWIFLFVWLVLIAYLLPDGRVLSGVWRWWLRGGLAGAVLFLVGSAGDDSGFREEHDGRSPPVPWLPEPLSGLLGVVGLALVVLLFLGSVPAVRSRLKRSSGEPRRQLLWLVWGAVAVPVGLLVIWANHFALGDHGWLTDAAITAISLALPAVITIAILRHRLFDIELVLSRTLSYGALLVGVVGLYSLMLLTAERLGGDSTAGGLLSVAVAAVALQPAYSWLRRRTERWVYGYRSEPHRAIRLLADRAEAAEPDTLSASITETVAEALRVDRVRVDTDGAGVDDPADDRSELVRVPLVHRGEHLGDLVVEVPPGRQMSSADVSLLHDLSRYAAVLVRADRQSHQLRESRSRIVAGREEERRRLRRNLHDGLGPSLAALVLKLDAAQSRTDEVERNAVLAETRQEVKAAIAEVRRLVDDLRPPAIDEVGLLGAIRQRAVALSGDLTIEVTGPDPMPALPAAVEVAAFRIASEAMTNVVRHADATRCRVAVNVNGRFELTVVDNGRGARAPGLPGIGWTSMRDRAAELGGSCAISTSPEGGLVVRALLPIEQRPAEGVEEADES